ncbi:MAG: EthD domain-containing protein [Novosphingobium sp.]|nr:EthD domain-containing protein [Novosphingobium sp.]
MFKCIALLKKRADISREEFIDYYRNNHSVLIRSLLPGIVDYRSNFVDLEGAFMFPDASPIDFDVITEIWLEDRAAYDHFVARAAEPDVARRIAEDEENLFERGASRMMVVEECHWTKQPA